MRPPLTIVYHDSFAGTSTPGTSRYVDKIRIHRVVQEFILFAFVSMNTRAVWVAIRLFIVVYKERFPVGLSKDTLTFDPKGMDLNNIVSRLKVWNRVKFLHFIIFVMLIFQLGYTKEYLF